MTKTAAADILSRAIRVYARENGYTEITKALCESRMSEYTHPRYADTLKHEAALIANVKTVHRLATEFPLFQ